LLDQRTNLFESSVTLHASHVIALKRDSIGINI